LHVTCHTLLLGPQVFWQDGDRRVRLTTGEVEKVGHIVDRWITGTETGDTQVCVRASRGRGKARAFLGCSMSLSKTPPAKTYKATQASMHNHRGDSRLLTHTPPQFIATSSPCSCVSHPCPTCFSSLQVMSVDRLKEVLLQASAPEGMESKVGGQLDYSMQHHAAAPVCCSVTRATSRQCA
jgi:hypothetical protein